MARISPLTALPLVMALGFMGLAFWGMKRPDPNELPSTLIGLEVPPVALARLGEGAPFSDATLRDGKVKIVNFWASWCAPCRAEHPNLMQLQAEGLPVYGVNYKDKSEDALAFLAELGNPYTSIGADSSGRMGIDWGIYGVPETFVIDGEGRVILRFPGPLTERAIQTDLRPALKVAAAGE